MRLTRRVTRREFLRRSGLSAVGLGFAARAGAAKPAPPSATIRVGCIGLAGIGGHHFQNLLATPGVTVAAVCDVDEEQRLKAQEQAEHSLDAYNDYRRLLERNDIDAVFVATPDHWHCLITRDACQAGKDVYVEKPLAHTIEEGQFMVETARRYNRVVQMGTQQRSQPHFRHACELVRNGRLGKVSLCRTWFAAAGAMGFKPNSAPPPGFDFDMWLGPAATRPYNPTFHPFTWREFRDFSGGLMADWGVHLNDIVQWAMGTEHTGPRIVEGKGTLSPNCVNEWAQTMEVRYEYDDFELIWEQTDDYPEPGEGYGVKFYGGKGELYVNRETYTIHSDEEIDEVIGSDDVRLYASNDHHGDFFDCVRTRQKPICDVEIGHRSTLLSHLGNISWRLGRKLQWDPVYEQFAGDNEANQLKSKPYRAPWHL